MKWLISSSLHRISFFCCLFYEQKIQTYSSDVTYATVKKRVYHVSIWIYSKMFDFSRMLKEASEVGTELSTQQVKNYEKK